MKRIQRTVALAVIISQTSHVFCCVLPFVVSALSVLAGIGIISALPAGFESLHEVLHDYEVPLLVFSGAVLFIGWALYFVTLKYDCHTQCGHEPCAPKKGKVSKLLIGASVLFVFNIIVFTMTNHTLPSNAQAAHADHAVVDDHAHHAH